VEASGGTRLLILRAAKRRELTATSIRLPSFA